MENHIEVKSLYLKIRALMDYRLFPSLFDKSSLPNEDKVLFYNQLVDLQFAIYLLDAHLEVHWKVDQNVINKHYFNIATKLNVLGINNEDVGSYISHIKKYEKHELELRQGKTPLRFDMEYFYFYKSCDVKLLRRLIYEKFNLIRTCGPLAEWRYYDLITEVNDDIEDLLEDLQFFNGNRFLISIIMYGKSKTYHIYHDFIQQVLLQSELKIKHSRYELKDLIYEQTNLQLRETLNTMTQSLENVDEKELKTSVLFTHLQKHQMYEL